MSFCKCFFSFGYGVSIFVGSMEVSLMEYTKVAAYLIDENTRKFGINA